MRRQFRIITFAILFSFISNYAQNIEHMIPAGFNNPFLKSGEYISTFYFNSLNSESNVNEGISGFRRDEYSLNMRSYLGITDDITLSTRLFVFPKQTVSKSMFGDGGDRINTFNIRPEIILSYRLEKNIEIFGAIDYLKYTSSFKDSYFTATVPVGQDGSGNIIYEEREVVQLAMSDRSNSFANIKVGVTITGNLW